MATPYFFWFSSRAIQSSDKIIMTYKIRETHNNDLMLVMLKQEVRDGVRTDFQMKDDDVLIMRNRLCVSQDEELRKMILEEAHNAPYAMHPGSMKMY